MCTGAIFCRALTALVLGGVVQLSGWAKAPFLPGAIRTDLTRHLGKWRFAPNRTSEGEKCTTQVTGDLDGNGQADFAVYVRAGRGTNEARQRLIVYLQKEDGYVRRTLDRSSPGSDLCLHLIRKGAKDYNYETQKNFRYQHDTVGLFSEKGGYSYVYWQGRFYRIITSD